ncbi:RNA recognition motif domain-containing protein [Ditylenchus destructor]|nr:RNA recognition motif domain-containing protein [Ditylenchus destructor]
MSLFRKILQRCARQASLNSILGGTQLQIQCTFNPVYSYPTSISRLAYSGIANESSKNMTHSAQKSSFGQMDRALNSLPHYIDGEVIKNVRPGSLGRKQLTLQVLDLSPKTMTISQKAFYSKIESGGEAKLEVKDVPENVTEEALRDFYSKYGQLNRAMDDRPHIIGGKPLEVYASVGHRNNSLKISLFVGSLPENVTEETLREEFSRYGKLVYWKLQNDGAFNQSGPYGIVRYGSEEEALKALNSGPHTIDGAVVDVKKASEAKKSLSK